jgi:nucleoside-triphosphatase THEP1
LVLRQQSVPGLLDGRTPVIATVALKGDGLIAEAKVRPDVRLVHVGVENRDGLPEMLADWLRARKR